jgi:hypothetical protein
MEPEPPAAAPTGTPIPRSTATSTAQRPRHQKSTPQPRQPRQTTPPTQLPRRAPKRTTAHVPRPQPATPHPRPPGRPPATRPRRHKPDRRDRTTGTLPGPPPAVNRRHLRLGTRGLLPTCLAVASHRRGHNCLLPGKQDRVAVRQETGSQGTRNSPSQPAIGCSPSLRRGRRRRTGGRCRGGLVTRRHLLVFDSPSPHPPPPKGSTPRRGATSQREPPSSATPSASRDQGRGLPLGTISS